MFCSLFKSHQAAGPRRWWSARPDGLVHQGGGDARVHAPRYSHTTRPSPTWRQSSPPRRPPLQSSSPRLLLLFSYKLLLLRHAAT